MTAAHQQLSTSAATHSADPRTVSVTWANNIWMPSVMLQLSEHFSYPNTLRSQHVWISDLRLYHCNLYMNNQQTTFHLKIDLDDMQRRRKGFLIGGGGGGGGGHSM